MRHKADLIVMPILMFAFFALQLDRSNAGNAMTDVCRLNPILLPPLCPSPPSPPPPFPSPFFLPPFSHLPHFSSPSFASPLPFPSPLPPSPFTPPDSICLPRVLIADIGITQDWFNVGTQLLNAGIVLLEIPSNIVLYPCGPAAVDRGSDLHLGPRGHLPGLPAWPAGLPVHATAPRPVRGPASSPAALYTLSQWYKGPELSKRFALYFMGNGLATASGGLLAYGILRMRGVGGLAGWQWLFILEGIVTVTAGIVFVCFFPGTPSNPVSLVGLRFFSEREQMILRERVFLDDPTKRTGKKDIQFRDVRAAPR